MPTNCMLTDQSNPAVGFRAQHFWIKRPEPESQPWFCPVGKPITSGPQLHLIIPGFGLKTKGGTISNKLCLESSRVCFSIDVR